MEEVIDKKVAILVDNYFEQIEMTQPREALEAAGATVELIATKSTTVQGMNHAELADEFEADHTIDQVHAEDYDALVIPGGTINGDQLRVNETAQEWVQHFSEHDKPLAIICHGPWILINADCVEGKTVTSYPTLEIDLLNAGATEWLDEEVIVDGNLITSRKPDDLPAFNEALLSQLSMANVR